MLRTRLIGALCGLLFFCGPLALAMDSTPDTSDEYVAKRDGITPQQAQVRRLEAMRDSLQAKVKKLEKDVMDKDASLWQMQRDLDTARSELRIQKELRAAATQPVAASPPTAPVVEAIAPATRPSSEFSTPILSGDRVQVRGYYRKDGTYVAPYTRSKPKK